MNSFWANPVKALAAILPGLVWLMCGIAQAEDLSKVQNVKVNIRLIRASGLLQANSDSAGANSAPNNLLVHESVPFVQPVAVDKSVSSTHKLERPKLSVDRRIADLRSKLAKLQFQNYELIAALSENVPMGKKKVISLSDGHIISVRPLSLEKRRIELWLKWKDQSGMQILDTRLHFNCGESVLTGIETTEDGGIVLAVDVESKPS